MKNLHAEVLRLSLTSYKHLERFLNPIMRIVLISNFLNNAEDEADLEVLDKIVNTVQMYKLDDTIDMISSTDSIIEALKDSLIITKVEPHSSSSMLESKLLYKERNLLINNKIQWGKVAIIKEEVEKEEGMVIVKVVDPKYVNNILNIIKNKGITRIVFLDDFVGTGTMANTILEPFVNVEKCVVCMYITNEGKCFLQDKKITVHYSNIAKVIEERLLSDFNSICSKFALEMDSQYCQNTAVSEEFRSPNNNHPYLYNMKLRRKKWEPLLAREIDSRRKRISRNLFSDKFINYITEDQNIRVRLESIGYDSRKKRKELLNLYMENETFSPGTDPASKMIAESIEELRNKLKRTNETTNSKAYM